MRQKHFDRDGVLGVPGIENHRESISLAEKPTGEIEKLSLCIQRHCKAENQPTREKGSNEKETPKTNTQTSLAMLHTSQGCSWPIAWEAVLKPALTTDPSSHLKTACIKKSESGRGQSYSAPKEREFSSGSKISKWTIGTQSWQSFGGCFKFGGCCYFGVSEAVWKKMYFGYTNIEIH